MKISSASPMRSYQNPQGIYGNCYINPATKQPLKITQLIMQSSKESGDGGAKQVLFEKRKFARILTLNRPRQLNALSFQMITDLLKHFTASEEDPSVKLLILKVFAMPETALGMFPDISYFLSRLPGFFGEYVGLTGARLNGAEMLACGFATHFVPSDRLNALEESLTKVGSSDPLAVSAVIDKYSEQVPLKETSASNRLDVIDKCFSKKSVEEIISALEQETVNNAEWILAAVQSLKKASPLSLKISLRLIREGRLQSVGECLVKDYRICCHILRKEASKDFFEGCRALLVDKDKNPKWEPSRLELVDDAMVDRYFSKVDEEGWEDLKLPARQGPGFKLGSKL